VIVEYSEMDEKMKSELQIINQIDEISLNLQSSSSESNQLNNHNQSKLRFGAANICNHILR